jgi:ketosteroid isomerase-like protein
MKRSGKSLGTQELRKRRPAASSSSDRLRVEAVTDAGMKSSKLVSAILLLVALSLFQTACKKAQNENRVENPAQQQQMIQALRDAYTAFNRGDIDAAVKPLDEHIEWTEPDSFPGGGTYHGREGAHRYLAQSRARIAEGTSEPEKFIVAGNRIVVFVRANVRPKGSNEWVDLRVADVYTVRKGKAIDMHAFSDRQEALRWAGAVEVNQLMPALNPEPPKTSSEVAAESTSASVPGTRHSAQR